MADDTTRLDEVRDAYTRRRSLIKSLFVKYTIKSEPLVSKPLLVERMGTSGASSKEITEVVQGPKLYQRTIEHRASMRDAMKALRADRPELFEKDRGGSKYRFGAGGRPPIELVEPYLAKLPVEKRETIRIFDGELIRQKLPTAADVEAETFWIKKPTAEGARLIGQFYLDSVLLGVDDPGVSRDGKEGSRFKIPEMFDAAAFAVAANDVAIDGHACLVAECQGYQRLYLDPKLGYAVRRRDALADGELVYTADYSDFVEILEGVWMPRRIVAHRLDTAAMPANFKGAKGIKMTYAVVEINVNMPSHGDYFILTPPPGAIVVDERVRPLNDAHAPLRARALPPGVHSGGRVVPYVQPASAADLDRTIEEAREADAMRSRGALPYIRSRGARRVAAVLIGLNLIILIVVLAVKIARRRRQRTRDQ